MLKYCFYRIHEFNYKSKIENLTHANWHMHLVNSFGIKPSNVNEQLLFAIFIYIFKIFNKITSFE